MEGSAVGGHLTQRALSANRNDMSGQNLSAMGSTRSQAMLMKINQGKGKPNNMFQNTIRLFLLGKNEIFGLEEIVLDVKMRQMTVTCASTTGECYFLAKDKFIHDVNLFKISDQALNETFEKHKMYMERVNQT